MKGRTGIAALLASSAWMTAAIVSPASAQQAVDAAARADAYRQVDRALKELDREARMARGGPQNACARFEQLLGSLSEWLGPRSVLHRETLAALRSRFATIVNRGCPEGTPGRTFRIDQAGNIRDSGPQRPIPPQPSPTPRTAEQVSPAPQQEPARVAPDPVPPNPDADDLDAIVDDPIASLRPQGLAPDEREAPTPAAPPGTTEQPGPAPQGLTPGDEAMIVAQQQLIARVEANIKDAEAAWARGDCEQFRNARNEARENTDLKEEFFPPELIERWRSRIRTLSALSCPPPGMTPPQEPARGLPSPFYRPAEFWLGLGETDTPQTGIGVTHEPPATETDAALTTGKVRTAGIGGSLGLPLGRTRMMVNASYHWGDGRTAFDVAPISGGFNGAVFGDRSDSGSTGIGAGSVALVGETRVRASQFRLGAEVDLFAPTPASRVFVTFDYFHDVRRHDLALAGTVSSVRFDQHRNQRVHDNAFDLGIGGEARIPLGGTLQFDIRAWAAGSYGFGKLRSNERNSSNFGPNSDRDFAIDITDKDEGFGAAVAADARLGYAVSPRLTLFVGGGASYRSRVSAVWNPNSGDQVLDGLRTGLRTADGWSWRMGAGISIALGK